jgi:hypothetical protein
MRSDLLPRLASGAVPDSALHKCPSYLIAELRKVRVIDAAASLQSGQPLPMERVNHYIVDGEIALATLMTDDA